MSKVGNKYYPTVKLKEYYVLLEEEGEFYLSHVTTEDGTNRGIAKCIYNEIKGTSLESNLCIIGSDGTATMTGNKSGCIALLKAMLGRPLQCAICLLHSNKLRLRHIF